MIEGDIRILYIYDKTAYSPIGCLTENSFSESVEMLDTTTRDNGGWKTYTYNTRRNGPTIF